MVTPGNHRNNPAERAIQTYRSYFLSARAGVDPSFPAKNWDLILSQVSIIVNLVLPSQINPLISAYNQVHGAFDYNSTPMEPIGTKVILFDHNRVKWDDKGINSFYIGPAMKHYRNFVCYNPATNKTRTHDMLQWFPHDDLFPFVPGTATTTNLLLLELIETLNGSNTAITSDVPTMIRQVQSLLHKRKLLPSATSIHDHGSFPNN